MERAGHLRHVCDRERAAVLRTLIPSQHLVRSSRGRADTCDQFSAFGVMVPIVSGAPRLATDWIVRGLGLVCAPLTLSVYSVSQHKQYEDSQCQAA